MTAEQHHQNEDQGGDLRAQPDPRWPRLLWKITPADPQPGSGGGPGDVDGTSPEVDPLRLVVRRPTAAEAGAWLVRHRDRLGDPSPVLPPDTPPIRHREEQL